MVNLDKESKRMRSPEKKKPCSFMGLQGFNLAPRPGLEPGTYGLTVRRSTD